MPKPAAALLTAVVALPLVSWSGDTGKESTGPLRIDDEMPSAGKLTGDWGGLRTDLAAKGISIWIGVALFCVDLWRIERKPRLNDHRLSRSK